MNMNYLLRNIPPKLWRKAKKLAGIKKISLRVLILQMLESATKDVS